MASASACYSVHALLESERCHRSLIAASNSHCAWDALGIPAALHRAGIVLSRCEQSGEPLTLAVSENGPEPCSWVFHSLVRASRWWDDLVFT